ncbi:phage holin family protein [Candidatus Peregrinibacteria bacterium]|nr:phage holin family protein [Candidatus Peregrinibacteria bacterium]
MGLLNSIVKPILKLLTLPIQIITLGLSLIVLNGIIFWIFDVIIDTIALEGVSLTVEGIKTYFLAGVAFGVINWLEHIVVPK